MNTSDATTKPSFDLRAEIAALGLNQSSFARRLQEFGDDRPHKHILRTVQRMVAGDARVSGEIQAFIGLLKQMRDKQAHAHVSTPGYDRSAEEYETDFALWSEHQARLLAQRAAGEAVDDAAIDWPNIAEEIESLGRSDRRALESHVATIIEHLAKLQLSPAQPPRASWKRSVRNARTEIERLFRDSPSLRRHLDDIIAVESVRALKEAAIALEERGETPRLGIELLDFTADRLIGDWFPEAEP